jgi:hypothetical protein
MRVPFNERSIQSGGTMPHFAGYAHQRGAGLGSVFKTLWRFAMPFAKSAGKAIGRQALKSGADIAQDVLRGEEVKSVVKKRVKQGASALTKKGSKRLMRKLQTGEGLGKRPKGANRTRGLYKTKKTSAKRTKKRIDIFG